MSETKGEAKAVGLVGALAQFHLSLGRITKDSDNPFFKSKYADLSALLAVADKPLAEAGLAFLGVPQYRDGALLMVGLLKHTSGEEIEGVFPVFGNKPQEIGSSFTYARRYLFQSMLNLAAEDDDGNEANKGAPIRKPPVQAPRPSAPQAAPPVSKGAPEVTNVPPKSTNEKAPPDREFIEAQAWAWRNSQNLPQRKAWIVKLEAENAPAQKYREAAEKWEAADKTEKTEDLVVTAFQADVPEVTPSGDLEIF